jgi:hypothetical protein
MANYWTDVWNDLYNAVAVVWPEIGTSMRAIVSERINWVSVLEAGEISAPYVIIHLPPPLETVEYGMGNTVYECFPGFYYIANSAEADALEGKMKAMQDYVTGQNPRPFTALQFQPGGLATDVSETNEVNLSMLEAAMPFTAGSLRFRAICGESIEESGGGGGGGGGNGGGGSSGTVTSVGLVMPLDKIVSGSPITVAGTITVADKAQNAHTFKGGPASGGAGAPGYRSIVAGDLPQIPSSLVSGPIPSTQISGLGTASTHNDAEYEHVAGKGLAGGYAGLDASGKVPLASLPPLPSGTVTMVDMSVPAGFGVTGNPITGAGTIAISVLSQPARQFYGSPNAGPGLPLFRGIVASDLPQIPNTQVSGLGTAATHNDSEYEHVTGKGAASGYAALDALARVPLVSLPALVGSGSSHQGGIAPDPGATPGTTRYLREDATWAVPPGSGGSSALSGLSDVSLTTLSDGQVLTYKSASDKWVNQASASGGSVSMVALAAPPEFLVSGSPVTTTGTITLTKAPQAANLVNAGPVSGGPSAPGYRAIVVADLPQIPNTLVSGLGTASVHADTEYEHVAAKGVASGYAPLDATTHVPLALLPTIPSTQISGLGTSSTHNDTEYEHVVNKGVANGYAGLGSNGRVPAAQMAIMIGSGPGHQGGAVPDPGATANTVRYLCENGVWTAPPFGSTNLAGLSDVSLTTPQVGDLLTYQGSGVWANQAKDLSAYVLQAGRPSGQTVTGGNMAGYPLTLVGNSQGNPGTINYQAQTHIWYSDFGTTEGMRLTGAGFLVLKGKGVPVAGLSNSSLTLSLDDTPGATKLLITARDSGGTTRSTSISLT